MKDKKNIIIVLLIGIVVILGFAVFGEKQPTLSPGITQQSETQEGAPEVVERQVLSAKEAWKHIGESATVQYYVANPYQSSRGNVFLNEKRDYKNGFTTVIFANSVGKFGNPISLYGYKTIKTTGLIKMYQGHPEIIAEEPSQIEVIK